VPETTQNPAQSSVGKNGPFPPELAGWNWGAFFMGWIWALGMSNVISFLLCFFLSGIGNIIIGIKGNEWAWSSRKFDSVEQFRAVQHTWAVWGVVLFIISILISGGILLFTVLLAGSAALNSATIQ
jgi:hypothetical protein